jgi:hypothetical protein
LRQQRLQAEKVTSPPQALTPSGNVFRTLRGICSKLRIVNCRERGKPVRHLIVGLLVACAALYGCESSEIRDAKKAVLERLTDPDSAQFRNLKVIKSMDTDACKQEVRSYRGAFDKYWDACCHTNKEHPNHGECKTTQQLSPPLVGARIFERCVDALVQTRFTSLESMAKQEKVCEARPSVVCGEFNSKNRAGGYVGFGHFAYVVDFKSKALGLSDHVTVGLIERRGTKNEILFEIPVKQDTAIGVTKGGGPYFNCGAN